MSFKDGRIGVGKDPIFPLDISGSCRIDGDLILGGRFSDSQGNAIQLGSGSGATSTPDQSKTSLPSWNGGTITTQGLGSEMTTSLVKGDADFMGAKLHNLMIYREGSFNDDIDQLLEEILGSTWPLYTGPAQTFKNDKNFLKVLPRWNSETPNQFAWPHFPNQANHWTNSDHTRVYSVYMKAKADVDFFIHHTNYQHFNDNSAPKQIHCAVVCDLWNDSFTSVAFHSSNRGDPVSWHHSASEGIPLKSGKIYKLYIISYFKNYDFYEGSGYQFAWQTSPQATPSDSLTTGNNYGSIQTTDVNGISTWYATMRENDKIDWYSYHPIIQQNGPDTAGGIAQLNLVSNHLSSNLTAGRNIGRINFKGRWHLTSPSSILEFGGIRCDATGTAGSTSSRLTFHNNNGTERMRIDGNGNVGIGTTSPETLLTLGNHAYTAGPRDLLRFASFRHGEAFTIRNNDDESTGRLEFFWGNSTNNSGSHDNTTDNLVLTLRNNGHVGIGTNSPLHKLHVANLAISNTMQDLICLETQTSSEAGHPAVSGIGQGILFKNKWHTNATKYSMARISAHSQPGYGGQLSFWTNNGTNSPDDTLIERLRINHNGNVGIGTTAPSLELDVHGSGRIGRYLTGSCHDADKRNSYYFGRWDQSDAPGSGDYPGGAFIGMELKVGYHTDMGYGNCGNQSSVRFWNWGCNYATSRVVMRITADGYVRGINAFQNNSDDRLKHNEKNINVGLNVINKLQAKEYFKTSSMFDKNGNMYGSNHNFNLNTDGLPIDNSGILIKGVTREMGFIAQDVLKIDELKHAVHEGNLVKDANGNTYRPKYGLTYQDIFVMNVAATQELDRKVIALEEKIETLTKENQINRALQFMKIETLTKENQEKIETLTKENQEKIETLTKENYDQNVKILDLYKENERLKARLAKIEAFLGI